MIIYMTQNYMYICVCIYIYIYGAHTMELEELEGEP
jgi:hypothetical protein